MVKPWKSSQVFSKIQKKHLSLVGRQDFGKGNFHMFAKTFGWNFVNGILTLRKPTLKRLFNPQEPSFKQHFNPSGLKRLSIRKNPLADNNSKGGFQPFTTPLKWLFNPQELTLKRNFNRTEPPPQPLFNTNEPTPPQLGVQPAEITLKCYVDLSRIPLEST